MRPGVSLDAGRAGGPSHGFDSVLNGVGSKRVCRTDRPPTTSSVGGFVGGPARNRAAASYDRYPPVRSGSLIPKPISRLRALPRPSNHQPASNRGDSAPLWDLSVVQRGKGFDGLWWQRGYDAAAKCMRKRIAKMLRSLGDGCHRRRAELFAF